MLIRPSMYKIRPNTLVEICPGLGISLLMCLVVGHISTNVFGIYSHTNYIYSETFDNGHSKRGQPP